MEQSDGGREVALSRAVQRLHPGGDVGLERVDVGVGRHGQVPGEDGAGGADPAGLAGDPGRLRAARRVPDGVIVDVPGVGLEGLEVLDREREQVAQTLGGGGEVLDGGDVHGRSPATGLLREVAVAAGRW